jgi:hypothetical protein
MHQIEITEKELISIIDKVEWVVTSDYIPYLQMRSKDNRIHINYIDAVRHPGLYRIIFDGKDNIRSSYCNFNLGKKVSKTFLGIFKYGEKTELDHDNLIYRKLKAIADDYVDEQEEQIREYIDSLVNNEPC